MEFRLIYQGRLPAQGSGGGGAHVREKHEIRRQLHSQLKMLWQDHPALRQWETHQDTSGRTFAEASADRYERCGKRFLPLVTEHRGLACSLDILFLRRDQPGGLIVSGGDIDNRIKTLLDALQIPHDCGQIPPMWAPTPEENPLYCVLEDDKLINDLTVTTDRLIQPKRDAEHIHDVHLIIRVKTIITNHDRAYIEFM